MTAIRSLLWIGPGDGLARDRVADAPALDVTWASDVEEAVAFVPARFDAVLLDAPDADSLPTLLRRLRRHPQVPPCIARVRCAPEQPLDAARVETLLAAGAADVWSAEPRDEDSRSEAQRCTELVARVDRLLDRPRPKQGRSAPVPGVLGQSIPMQRVFELVERAAASAATVLLTGETGTGKEVLARALHARGGRARRPFVAVNCAAFPDTLLESELFGHTRGSFTGAERDQPGLFVAADGGTLFLDEIGETSGPLQAKLLRALQEREVRPVGGARARAVDVRLIAATNRDLRREASRGAFRDDLYYRLAVFPIEVPPLRQRREDVLPLARHFLALHGEREGKRGCRLSREAEQLLVTHPWPGNVRELENEMQRVLALSEPSSEVPASALSARLAAAVEPARETERPQETLRESLDRVEAWLIQRALDRQHGRKAAAARQLGVTREGLYKKMRRLGIE